MAFSKTKQIGKSSNFFNMLIIMGRSLALGDDGNTLPTVGVNGQNRVTTGANYSVGWDINISPVMRSHPYIRIPLRNVVPAFSRVFRATMYLPIATRGAWPSGTVNAGKTVKFYGIRRPGFDESTFTFQIYKTGSNWDEYAGKIGTDLTSAELGSMTFTQADYDSMATGFGGTGGPVVWKAVDITSEVSYRVDRNEDAIIMGHIWAFPGNIDEFFTIRNSTDATNQAFVNAYLDIEYVPPIVFHGCQAVSGRPIDLSKVLDVEPFESDRHVYGGFIDSGESGEVYKYALRNSRKERTARRIVIEATRSIANTPASNVLNSGNAKLRSVDTFDLTTDISGAITKLTPRGRWELRFISSTNYDVYFDEGFTGTYSLVIANRSMASDVTVQVSSKDAIRIRAAKFSGTPANTDKINFDTVGDTTPTSYPADSKDMMFLIPPTVAGGDIADTAQKRTIKGTTQQTRASSWEVSDGGSDRTVIALADAELQGFTVGQPCTVFAGTTSASSKIRQIYNTAASLPAGAPGGTGNGDAVMLEDDLGMSFAAGSFFTTGLYIASLATSDDTLVGAAGAAAGQNVIPVASAVNWATNDEFTVVHLATNQIQELVVQANNNSSITANANLQFALSAGDLIIKKVAGNWASFFFQGAVPDGAALGDRFSILRAYEARTSLKNIV